MPGVHERARESPELTKSAVRSSSRSLAEPRLWLSLTLSLLVLIHLVLVARLRGVGQLGISVLCWYVVLLLLWRKRSRLNLESGPLPSAAGVVMVALVLSVSVRSPSTSFLHLLPFISGLAVGLLASGFLGLKQFLRELCILFFLGVPRVMLPKLIDISPYTAKFSAFLLWYSGFDVSLSGVHIQLPGGGVEVNSDCDGMEATTYLLCLAVLFLITFPVRWRQAVLVPFVAVLSAFAANGVRVAILALISSSSSTRSFDFWHQGRGSLVWTVLPVVVFGVYCIGLLRANGRMKPPVDSGGNS